MLTGDVVVIGCGAVGTAIARELSRFDLKVVLVDKRNDVGGDASKSNSAIIHTGFDATPGTLESRLVTAANSVYDRLAYELDIPFKRTGAILAAVTDEQAGLLPGILKKAHLNGVYDVEKILPQTAGSIEPSITDQLKSALFIPRESIIDPFLYVAAMAENAVLNGVTLLLSAPVLSICREGKQVTGVKTGKGDIRAPFVINAAGLHGDDIAEMAGLKDFNEHPRKGQFYILDKNTSVKPGKIILPVPTKNTKGILISPTIHGNILLGPTAEDLEDKGDRAVTAKGLKEVREGAARLVPGLSVRDVITTYCGLRPVKTPEGYSIRAREELKGYIEVTGIRSTGLTASATIAKYVVDIMDNEGLPMELKSAFNPYRLGIKRFAALSWKEREQLLKHNPEYGNIVCRCEQVTEGEIVQAVTQPAGARTMDGVKRRLRAGMGRCQGGFCSPKVLEILSRELGVPPEDILKDDAHSEILTGRNR